MYVGTFSLESGCRDTGFDGGGLCQLHLGLRHFDRLYLWMINTNRNHPDSVNPDFCQFDIFNRIALDPVNPDGLDLCQLDPHRHHVYGQNLGLCPFARYRFAGGIWSIVHRQSFQTKPCRRCGVSST